ncbi:hypothetical protein [Terrihabitans rhizophilus]|uniref:Uncharacterized protein n=1 Tax=Terrihabitans rhizophilus TaxID=3092662 RepID=A0ABU4RLT5_9HYPH|nr:hypothetical protein [Terrihabitans sp. PJ23]MDX6805556.1 hypothetical protein [Terrihabitans sp. PJ23]
MTSARQAILFLTHVRSARVLQHLERLRRETAGLMPVFVCVDDRGSRRDTAASFPSDFSVREEDWRRLAPARAAHLRHGPRTDYYDLFYLPALLSERLSGFDHVWFIENDVDFAGNWGDFFRPAMQSAADLLATTVYPRPLQPGWTHWRRFRTPERIPQERHIRAFLPLARFSQRLIRAYAEEAHDPAWAGQFEAMWPTLAAERGWPISDLGGAGPFQPAEGFAFYRNTFNRRTLSPGNFVFRPARRVYFHEDPAAFPETGQLYHPVKGW